MRARPRGAGSAATRRGPGAGDPRQAQFQSTRTARPSRKQRLSLRTSPCRSASAVECRGIGRPFQRLAPRLEPRTRRTPRGRAPVRARRRNGSHPSRMSNISPKSPAMPSGGGVAWISRSASGDGVDRCGRPRRGPLGVGEILEEQRRRLAVVVPSEHARQEAAPCERLVVGSFKPEPRGGVVERGDLREGGRPVGEGRQPPPVGRRAVSRGRRQELGPLARGPVDPLAIGLARTCAASSHACPR